MWRWTDQLDDQPRAHNGYFCARRLAVAVWFSVSNVAAVWTRARGHNDFASSTGYVVLFTDVQHKDRPLLVIMTAWYGIIFFYLQCKIFSTMSVKSCAFCSIVRHTNRLRTRNSAVINYLVFVKYFVC